MPHPEMELQEEHEQNMRSSMQAVYPSTEKLSTRGITNKVMSKIMQQLFFRYQRTVSRNACRRHT